MTLTVRFKCGHEMRIPRNIASPPVCHCGERRIARTFGDTPRFRGTCSGPCAETVALEPGIVNVASSGSLILKGEE